MIRLFPYASFVWKNWLGIYLFKIQFISTFRVFHFVEYNTKNWRIANNHRVAESSKIPKIQLNMFISIHEKRKPYQKRGEMCCRRIIWLLLMHSIYMRISKTNSISLSTVSDQHGSSPYTNHSTLLKCLSHGFCAAHTHTQTQSQPISFALLCENHSRVRCLRAHFVCTQTANCLHSAVTHNSQFESQTVETWHSTNNTLQK